VNRRTPIANALLARTRALCSHATSGRPNAQCSRGASGRGRSARAWRRKQVSGCRECERSAGQRPPGWVSRFDDTRRTYRTLAFRDKRSQSRVAIEIRSEDCSRGAALATAASRLPPRPVGLRGDGRAIVPSLFAKPSRKLLLVPGAQRTSVTYAARRRAASSCFALGTSSKGIEPRRAFRQPSRNSHVVGRYTTSGRYVSRYGR
jgi:hypothetical protein